MLDGTLSRSIAPGSAGAATVAAGVAAEAAGRATGRGGGSGVVPMTRISGRVAALESAVGLEACCAATMPGAMTAAQEAALSRA